MTDYSLRIYDSILDLLPNAENPTPLVRLRRVTPFEHTEVYAKLEWYNPFGAVKDRVAASMVADAERRSRIASGQDLVEPTSGNTGLGLAMVANDRGYSLTTPVSARIPQEKRTMLRFFGSNVVELEDELCPAPGAPEGAIARAHEIAAAEGFEMLDQYSNEANPGAHYRTTGPEIWRQTGGTVTHFVAALGTCGTITGTGRFLKEQDPNIEVIGVHPGEGHDIPGVRSIKQLHQTEFFDPDSYDGLVEIADDEAYDLCLRLNREESITAGPSSALALAGAFRSVPDRPGTRVVVVFADSIFKYASSIGEHFPGMGPKPVTAGGIQEYLFYEMLENTRVNPDLTVDVGTAHERWRSGRSVVLDVRDRDAYAASHLAGSLNVPLDELPEHVDALPEDRDTPILALCQRGEISLTAVLFLVSLGYRDVRSVDGGTIAWEGLGLPMESADPVAVP